jgi:hypothetical protein
MGAVLANPSVRPFAIDPAIRARLIPAFPHDAEREVDLEQWLSTERAHRIDCPYCGDGLADRCSEGARLQSHRAMLLGPDLDVPDLSGPGPVPSWMRFRGPESPLDP